MDSLFKDKDKKEKKMSTNDVPGAKSYNNDELAIGCWAEHNDGSLILVESSEGGRVIYSVFDISKAPPVEFRDSMPEQGFKDHFTWDPDNKNDDQIKWVWHDKSPFPWDRIIKEGIPDGVRHACAHDLITSANRVAESRSLHGKEVDTKELEVRLPKTVLGKLNRAGNAVISGIQKAISELNE